MKDLKTEFYTVADFYKENAVKPFIQKGDIVKIIPMSRFKAEKVVFYDTELQEKMADGFFKITDIRDNDGIVEMHVEDNFGTVMGATIYESDIEYIIRNASLENLFAIEFENGSKTVMEISNKQIQIPVKDDTVNILIADENDTDEIKVIIEETIGTPILRYFDCNKEICYEDNTFPLLR